MPYATTAKWYTAHNCTHAHCPHDCEHPQPQLDGDDLLCGRCLVIERRRTPMLPCTPEVCA
jgi:hypothetical protein